MVVIGRFKDSIPANGKWSDGGTTHLIGGRIVFAIPDGGDLAAADVPWTVVPNSAITPASTKYRVEIRMVDANGATHARTAEVTVSASSPEDIGDLFA